VNEALVISNVILWVVVVLLAGVVVALVRQIGVLYERVAPAGALMTGKGPMVGEAAPVMQVPDLSGALRQIGGMHPDGRSTLVFFLSPTCPV
jgi:methylamine dehydrogenase accessory protein MauD